MQRNINMLASRRCLRPPSRKLKEALGGEWDCSYGNGSQWAAALGSPRTRMGSSPPKSQGGMGSWAAQGH